MMDHNFNQYAFMSLLIFSEKTNPIPLKLIHIYTHFTSFQSCQIGYIPNEEKPIHPIYSAIRKIVSGQIYGKEPTFNLKYEFISIIPTSCF